MNKTKGIIKSVAEELAETAKKTGQELKNQVTQGAEKTAAVIVGGKKTESSQNVSDLALKEKKKRKEGIAHFQRIIREEREGNRQVQGASQLENKQTQEEESKPEKMKGLIKPPGSIKRKPGINFLKKPKKGLEIRDIKSG